MAGGLLLEEEVPSEVGEQSTRIEAPERKAFRYLSTVRDIGKHEMGSETCVTAGDCESGWIQRLKRFRDGKVVCVLGKAAMEMVTCGLYRNRAATEAYSSRIKQGEEEPFPVVGHTDGHETATTGESTEVVSGTSNASHSTMCCGNSYPEVSSEECNTHRYTVDPEEVEFHSPCGDTGTDRSLVNSDLLAYLKPYAMFQARNAGLVSMLKGRAMIWRRRQMVSEHCFAHFMPGTVIAAMDMGYEEVAALRSMGRMSDAVKDVYADGIDPAQLKSWCCRGGTENLVRPSWILGSLKVDR
jgi:hypothetical protein